mmetsp:Transcript_43331/g.94372  ORF Transcript_43331/g.94372 Transcript_43331/m.94372 type:complete len:258 (+) Transcript_43331:758-1531(+)
MAPRKLFGCGSPRRLRRGKPAMVPEAASPGPPHSAPAGPCAGGGSCSCALDSSPRRGCRRSGRTGRARRRSTPASYYRKCTAGTASPARVAENPPTWACCPALVLRRSPARRAWRPAGATGDLGLGEWSRGLPCRACARMPPALPACRAWLGWATARQHTPPPLACPDQPVPRAWPSAYPHQRATDRKYRRHLRRQKRPPSSPCPTRPWRRVHRERTNSEATLLSSEKTQSPRRCGGHTPKFRWAPEIRTWRTRAQQ